MQFDIQFNCLTPKIDIFEQIIENQEFINFPKQIAERFLVFSMNEQTNVIIKLFKLPKPSLKMEIIH